MSNDLELRDLINNVRIQRQTDVRTYNTKLLHHRQLIDAVVERNKTLEVMVQQLTERLNKYEQQTKTKD